jgi:hypothetical protein
MKCKECSWRDVEIERLKTELSKARDNNMILCLDHDRLTEENKELFQRMAALELDNREEYLPRNKKKLARIVIEALTARKMTNGEARNVISILTK